MAFSKWNRSADPSSQAGPSREAKNTPPQGFPWFRNEVQQVDSKLKYWESVGFNVKPIGRGKAMEMSRKNYPDVIDSEVKDQLNDCPSLNALRHGDGLFAYDPRKRENFTSSVVSNASQSAPRSEAEQIFRAYDPIGTPKNEFVLRNEDFPPL